MLVQSPRAGTPTSCWPGCERVLGDRLSATHSTRPRGYGLVEISARGVNKASMLARVCARLGIDARRRCRVRRHAQRLSTCSAGSGMPYVVANAHPALLAQDFAVVPRQRRVRGRADHPGLARSADGLDGATALGPDRAGGRGRSACCRSWWRSTSAPPPSPAARRCPGSRSWSTSTSTGWPGRVLLDGGDFYQPARPAAVPLPAVRRPARGSAGGAAGRAGPDRLDRRRGAGSWPSCTAAD